MDEGELRRRDGAGEAEAARQLGILLQERGDLEEAEAAFTRAGERGDATALGKLAILIDVHRDDPDRAEAAYRCADEAGSVDGAGNLGRILQERGDLRGAEQAFKRCVDRGSLRALGSYAGLVSQREDASAEEVAEVVRRLCLAEDRGLGIGVAESDLEALPAVAVFAGMWDRCEETALEAGVRAADREGSASAAWHLALLLRGRSETAAAVEAFQRAGERGRADAWVKGAALKWEWGERATARAWAEHAESLGEAGGATLLGIFCDQEGDSDGALAAYQRADAGGDGDGSYNLGIELLERKRREEAEAALARAEERGIARAADARERVRILLGWEPVAAADGSVPAERRVRRGELLEELGDPAGEAEFEHAAQADDPALRARAWRGISAYRLQRGELDSGLAALHEVTATEDPEEAPRAWANIGAMLEDRGRVDAARDAYGAAIAFDHPKHSRRAKTNYAQLLEGQGDIAGAIARFREVAEDGHPEESPRAMVLLGSLLRERREGDAALGWFQRAIATGNAEWAQRAQVMSGDIYTQREQLDLASAAFRAAAELEAGDAEEATRAYALLGITERERGRFGEARDALETAVRRSEGEMRQALLGELSRTPA